NTLRKKNSHLNRTNRQHSMEQEFTENEKLLIEEEQKGGKKTKTNRKQKVKATSKSTNYAPAFSRHREIEFSDKTDKYKGSNVNIGSSFIVFLGKDELCWIESHVGYTKT